MPAKKIKERNRTGDMGLEFNLQKEERQDVTIANEPGVICHEPSLLEARRIVRIDQRLRN